MKFLILKLSVLFLLFNILFAKDINLPPLEIGDLVFRKGLGAESLLIEKLSDSPYTHIAMVVQTKPIILIHATTDDDKNKKNQVILSSLENFVKYSHKIAIKRLKFSKENKEKIINFAKQNLGKKFVLSSSQDSLYCTTLIENSINQVENFKINKDFVNIPYFKGYYLFPKAFFADERSVLVYESEEY